VAFELFHAQTDKIVEEQAVVPLQWRPATESPQRLCGDFGWPWFGQVKDERKRVTVLYSGQVQGVGFRYTVCELARGFDVCGTVRNLADGRVELIAEGLSEELTVFMQAIRDSGLGPLIRDEATDWSGPGAAMRGFQVLR
jgi:acylphosphatase